MMASISCDSVAGKEEGACELIRNDTRAFRVFNTSCLRPGIVQRRPCFCVASSGSDQMHSAVHGPLRLIGRTRGDERNRASGEMRARP
jgi:hypothetical protein